MNLKTVYSLIIARNKEFYRDRGSLTWALIFPLLVITAITFAFQDEDQVLFKAGILGDSEQLSNLSLREQGWITWVEYKDEQRALEKVRHHQLDLLLKPGANENQPLHYWINSTASRGDVLEQLLLSQHSNAIKQTVEGRPIRYIDWVIPGVLGMNIMFGALFGIGYVIVRYRKMEVLKRLQATPVSAMEYLTAQVFSRMLMLVTVSCAIFTGCNLFLHFLMLGSYWTLFCIAVVGAAAMISLGLVIASRTDSEELAGGMLNFATFPMLLLSEVWFSLDGAPEWMKTISEVLPLTHMVAAARKVMLEGAGFAEISLHLSILVGMTVTFLILASFLFRWSKS